MKDQDDTEAGVEHEIVCCELDTRNDLLDLTSRNKGLFSVQKTFGSMPCGYFQSLYTDFVRTRHN
jgi:hypothetical protein